MKRHRATWLFCGCGVIDHEGGGEGFKFAQVKVDDETLWGLGMIGCGLCGICLLSFCCWLSGIWRHLLSGARGWLFKCSPWGNGEVEFFCSFCCTVFFYAKTSFAFFSCKNLARSKTYSRFFGFIDNPTEKKECCVGADVHWLYYCESWWNWAPGLCRRRRTQFSANSNHRSFTIWSRDTLVRCFLQCTYRGMTKRDRGNWIPR